jgi:hypothetical protein
LAAQSASATNATVGTRAAIAAMPAIAACRGGVYPISSHAAIATLTTDTAGAALTAETAISAEATGPTGDRSAVEERIVNIRKPTGDACAAHTSRFTIASVPAV